MGKELSRELRNEITNAFKIACDKQSFDKVEQINIDINNGKAKMSNLKEVLKENDSEQVEKMAEASKRVRSFNSVLKEISPGASPEFQQHLGAFMMGSKSYNFSSTADIRIIDLSTVYDHTDTTETPFLNTLDAATGTSSRDIQFKYFELGSNTALDSMYFDPNGSPNVTDSQRTPRTNTMSFVGTGQQTSMIAEDINSNMGFTSQMEEAMSRGYNDLLKVKDRGLLLNTESTVPPYRNGGLIARTTTNVWAVGGDFTDATLDANMVDPIVKLYGPQRFMLAVPNRRQISIIDGFRSTRAPGRQPLDLEFGMMQGSLNGRNIPMSTMYNSLINGYPIPVFYLHTLPAGTAMLYSSSSVKQRYLQLGSFGSGPGPYVLISVQANGFAKVMQMFTTFSLENMGEHRCAKATGLT